MRENDEYNGEMASWPFGMVRKEMCAFGTFCKIWNEYLPFISIRSPSLDTCLQCHVFRNQSKYKNSVELMGISRFNEDSSSASLSQVSVTSDRNPPPTCKDVPLHRTSKNRKERLQELLQNEDETEEYRENIVIAAAAHVKSARSQKDLAAKKIELAKENTDVITLVIDYCQNIDLPHVGQEQPGDTYYYSPIWLYCLGIVNSHNNSLHAYVYPESAAKKGKTIPHLAFSTSSYIQSLIYHS